MLSLVGSHVVQGLQSALRKVKSNNCLLSEKWLSGCRGSRFMYAKCGSAPVSPQIARSSMADQRRIQDKARTLKKFHGCSSLKIENHSPDTC